MIDPSKFARPGGPFPRTPFQMLAAKTPTAKIIVLVVLLGVVFAQVLANPASVLSNSQVLGRTSPTLMDLTAALATGLVGAVAITRRDVGDVLPGVAIAISLVPPLAVVGVCLGSGAGALAAGAFILFASNVIAMIITATVVLLADQATKAAIVASIRNRPSRVSGTSPSTYQWGSRAFDVTASNSAAPPTGSGVNAGNRNRSIWSKRSRKWAGGLRLWRTPAY